MKQEEIHALVDKFVGPEAAEIMDEIAEDPEAFLNTPHVPEDAGEYADGLAAILARIPDGWGRWIRCGKGWYPLLVETDQKLAALDPFYEIQQCKEKFASLRYYYSIHNGCDSQAARAIVNDAERRSAIICEDCGEPGISRDGGWVRTLCDEHADGRPAWKELE